MESQIVPVQNFDGQATLNRQNSPSRHLHPPPNNSQKILTWWEMTFRMAPSKSSCEGNPPSCTSAGNSIEVDQYGGLVDSLRKEATGSRFFPRVLLCGNLGNEWCSLFCRYRRFLLPVFWLLPCSVSPVPFTLSAFSFVPTTPAFFTIFALCYGARPTRRNRRRLNSHPSPSHPKRLAELRYRWARINVSCALPPQQSPKFPCTLATTIGVSDWGGEASRTHKIETKVSGDESPGCI